LATAPTAKPITITEIRSRVSDPQVRFGTSGSVDDRCAMLHREEALLAELPGDPLDGGDELVVVREGRLVPHPVQERQAVDTGPNTTSGSLRRT